MPSLINMTPQTQLIIEALVAVILIGILGYILVQIYGRTPSNNGGDTSQCQQETTYFPGLGGGCITCNSDNPNSDQTCWGTKQDCINGTFKEIQNGKGLCFCKSPWFGQKCNKQCDQNVKCKSGKCNLTTFSCIGQSGCKCPDGQTCSDGQTCDSCLGNRGPKFPDCSLQYYEDPPGTKYGDPDATMLPLQCMPMHITSSETINAACSGTYGPLAYYEDVEGDRCTDSGFWGQHGESPCTQFLGNHVQFLCHVPKYYANPNWEQPFKSPCQYAVSHPPGLPYDYYETNPFIPPGYQPITS